MKEYKILLVEYLSTEANLTKREIEKVLENCQISIVETRQDCEDQLTKFKPDLVITTFKLPTFNALTVLQITKRISPHTPVIVFSGKLDDETIVTCMKSGASDCINKTNIKKLGKSIVTALEQVQKKRENTRDTETLQSDLERYSNIFINNPQPMYIFDLESLTFLEVNHATTELYGYTANEFQSMTLKDISPVGSIPSVLKGTKTQPTYHQPVNWWNLKNNGETIHVEIIYSVIDYKGRKACFVQVNDITERKKAWDALTLSEEKYRTLFENIQDVFFQTDLEGTIYEISPSVNQYLGYNRTVLIGNSVSELYCDMKERELMIKSLLENGEVQSFKIRLKTNTGKIKNASINARLIYDSEGRPDLVVGSIRDMSEGIEVVETLRKNEEKYRKLFENHTAVKLIIDPDTQQIIDSNHSASHFYGWTKEELKRLKIGDINTTTPDDLTTLIAKIWTLGNLHYEAKHRCKNGAVKDVEVFVSKIVISGKDYLYSIVHDITGRKETEQRTSILSKSIEQSPVGIMVTDPEGGIEYINPKYTVITGYSLEEIIGKNHWFLYSGKQSGEKYREMWKTIQSGKEWVGEFSSYRKNGESYWENINVSPMLNDKRKVTHVIVLIEDATQKHKLQEALITAKERAETIDKMKSDFLNNVSNEVRTPLNGIVGFTEMLVNPGFTEENKLNFIEIIKKSSARLLNTITGYTDISMIVSGNTKVYNRQFPINTVLDEVKTEFSEACNTLGLKLTLQRLETPVGVQLNTDPDILHKILIQLMSNSVKYTTKGSIEFGLRIRNNAPEFFVTDTGCGIESDRIKSIVEYFTKTDTTATLVTDGSGLGLSIARGLVKLLGGGITVESTLHKGTTFCFTLPAVTIVTTVVEEETKKKQLRVTKNPVILVAEDDDYNYKFIETVLNRADFKVVRAENGLEAVNICHENPNVNLVLMDLKMPVMGGIEATRQIKSFLPGLPVIALTAYVTSENENEAFLSGCKEFISKPVDRAHLLTKVGNSLGN